MRHITTVLTNAIAMRTKMQHMHTILPAVDCVDPVCNSGQMILEQCACSGVAPKGVDVGVCPLGELSVRGGG